MERALKIILPNFSIRFSFDIETSNMYPYVNGYFEGNFRNLLEVLQMFLREGKVWCFIQRFYLGKMQELIICKNWEI